MLIAATGDFHIGMKGKFREVFTLENIESCVRKLDYLPVSVFFFCGDLSMSRRYDARVRQALDLLRSVNARYRFMVPGNHDKWYDPSLQRVLSSPGDIKMLDGEGYLLDDLGIGVAGTMGWYDYSFSSRFSVEREKYEKAVKTTNAELRKLEAGLKSIEDAKLKIVVLHFSPTPETVKGDPLIETCGASKFMELLEAYEVDYVFHGHSHRCRDDSLEAVVGRVRVFNVACDKRCFSPLVLKLEREAT